MYHQSFVVVLVIVVTLCQLTRPAWGESQEEDPSVERKRNFVKKMMTDAWETYRRYAWGEFALNPIFQTPDYDGGVPRRSKRGTTILAALDTLYIMEIRDEFGRARDWVENNLDFDSVHAAVPIDEAMDIISNLLSAYYLTSDFKFIDKAELLASLYVPSFNSSTGLPFSVLNWGSKLIHTGAEEVSLDQLGRVYSEFMTLSNLTGKAVFRKKADGILKFLQLNTPRDGLLRDTIKVTDGIFGRDTLTGQSLFLSSLLNEWIAHGDTQARKVYDDAVRALERNRLIRTSSTAQLKYIPPDLGWQGENAMAFNSCISGATFALSAFSDPLRSNQTTDFLSLAKELTKTCHLAASSTRSKLPPARFLLSRIATTVGERRVVGPVVPASVYQNYDLQPYLAYSYFILYRLTDDPVYRTWGWQLAKAIQDSAKVGPAGGYAIVRNVNGLPADRGFMQPPHFLGGTLKFLYLLFSDPNLYSLNRWTFTYGGHLKPIEGRTFPSLADTAQIVSNSRSSSVASYATLYGVLFVLICTAVGVVGKYYWPRLNALSGITNNGFIARARAQQDDESIGGTSYVRM